MGQLTVVCQVPGCGQIVRLPHVIVAPADAVHGSIEHTRQAVTEIMTFDLLAAAMLTHIAARHPAQAKEMQEVANVAARVYCMTWAESSMPKFQSLRESWRVGMLHTLQLDGGGAAAAGSDSSGSSGNGSGE